MSEPTRPLSIRLPVSVIADLDRVAATEGRSRSNLIARLVAAGVASTRAGRIVPAFRVIGTGCWLDLARVGVSVSIYEGRPNVVRIHNLSADDAVVLAAAHGIVIEPIAIELTNDEAESDLRQEWVRKMARRPDAPPNAAHVYPSITDARQGIPEHVALGLVPPAAYDPSGLDGLGSGDGGER